MKQNYHVGELPHHLYVQVDSRFVFQSQAGLSQEAWEAQPHSQKYHPAVWFAVVSFPGRAWGATLHLECGAIYRALPLHSLSALYSNPKGRWTEHDAQLWDCYGYEFVVNKYNYLRGMRTENICHGNKLPGEYQFSIHPVNDGYSNFPEQNKEFHCSELENGRFVILPTNRIIFKDKSFTNNNHKLDIVLQKDYYSCE